MAEAIAAIGLTASILQLVGFLSQGLIRLQNAYAATRDVKKRIDEILSDVTSLEAPITHIRQYLQSQSPGIPADLHDVIRDVTTSCLESLRNIQEKLPVVNASTRRIETAVRMWMQDRVLGEARRRIDGSLQSLRFILQIVQMYVRQMHGFIWCKY